MSDQLFSGTKVLITQADAFMGPALCETFAEQGADVVPSTAVPTDRSTVDRLVREAGSIDVLVANLSIEAPSTPLTEADDAEWTAVFDALVRPLPWLFQAVLPPMVELGSGKILVIGSAAALRGIRHASTYSAARGAQLAYVRAAGVEFARHNIQINAIAQNFVDNATYFPPEVQADPRFQARLRREVPLGRLVSAREDAYFAAYLCSPAADCFVGQVFPIARGWA